MEDPPYLGRLPAARFTHAPPRLASIGPTTPLSVFLAIIVVSR